jgi:PHP-associated
MMSARTNAFAVTVGKAAGLPAVGGSDAHTPSSVARASTTVVGARDRAEFLAGLRRGLTIPEGASGSYARLTADVARIFGAAYGEAGRRSLESWRDAARLLTMPAAAVVLPLLPVVTAAIYGRELLFAAHHYRRFEASAAERRHAARRPFGAVPAAPSLS